MYIGKCKKFDIAGIGMSSETKLDEPRTTSFLRHNIEQLFSYVMVAIVVAFQMKHVALMTSESYRKPVRERTASLRSSVPLEKRRYSIETSSLSIYSSNGFSR